jgi:hypothetical protein
MPGKFEKRSARLLALFLALIMVGSAIAIAFRGMGPSKMETRSVKFSFKTFNEWLKCVPPTDEVIYVSLKNCTNATLWNYLQRVMDNNMISGFFEPVSFTTPIQRMLIAFYPNGLLYLVDINMSKMVATGEKVNVNGIDVWVKNVNIYNRYYEVAATPEISPAIVGTAPQVEESIKAITSNTTNMEELVGNYTAKIPGNFNAAFVFYGKKAESILQMNNTPYGDFYFAGIRMNGSLFEKVVAIHFIQPGGFVESNNTSSEFAHYWVKNYVNESLSVAVMDSGNLTKILNAEPEMRVISVHWNKAILHKGNGNVSK